MHNILITGATGLLGSSLVPHLRKCGHNIYTHGLAAQADVMFNLSDKVKTFQALDEMRPEMIINLVSLTDVELCEEQVNFAYLANTRSVENLVNWIGLSGTDCHLVHISTDHVYDGVGLHTEENVTLTNNYAFSKYAGELAASLVSSSILRTNFIGRSRVSHRQSLSDWIYASITSSRNIQILNDVYFSPLSIKALIEMIELVVQNKPVGIYNLGSHKGMSKADFAFSFAECLKLTTNTMKCIESSEAKFLKVYRPKNMRMDISKFENTLGVKLPNLTDLIQQVAEEYNEIN